MKNFWIALLLIFLPLGSVFAQKKNYKKLPQKFPLTKIEKAVEVPLVNPETPTIVTESVTPESEIISAEKFMSFRMNPVPLIVGSMDAAVEFKVSEHWQLGPHFVLMNTKSSDIEFANQGAGIRTTWTLEPVYQSSLYLQGVLGATKVAASYSDTTNRYTASSNSAYYYFGGGYNWQWTNFNLNLGLAISGNSPTEIKILNSNQAVVKAGSVPVKTALLFELGFAL